MLNEQNIIYEFTNQGCEEGQLYRIREVPKSSVPDYQIGVLRGIYYDKMYCLDNNPEQYIKAVNVRTKKRLDFFGSV